MTRRARAIGALMLTVAAGLTACTRDQSIDVPIQLPWAVTFQWETDPGVDLDSPVARVIRASVESNEIEKSIGRRYTYPGYAEAGAAGIGVLNGAIPLYSRTGSIGTMPMKLIVRQESADFIDAVVCSDLTRATDLRGGSYPLPPSGATFALASYRLIAQRGPHATPLSDALSVDVLQPQPSHDLTGPAGRAATPATDVFQEWTLTEFTMSAAPEFRNPCLVWAEQRWGGPNPPAPTRTEVEPPVIEPFYPGW